MPRHFAAAGSPGIAPLHPGFLLRQTREAAKQAKLIIVSLHADLEFTPYLSPRRIRLSRQLIEAGAHMVIQHHPHVFQGIETHKNGLIAYSLGNFVFSVNGNPYQENRPGTKESFVLQVKADKRGVAPSL